MNDQSSFFDEAAGEAAREEAIKRVERGADDDVKDALVEIGWGVAKTREQFTTDAIRYVYERNENPPIREPRVLGAIMRQLERDGACMPLDEWHQSVWAKNHRRPLRVWKSLVYKETYATPA